MAASFHIHLDCENDNPIKEIKNDIKNNLNKDKQQRTTFSILNYQANGTRTAHAPQKTVLGDIKSNNIINNNENDVPSKVIKSTSLTDQIKTFRLDRYEKDEIQQPKTQPANRKTDNITSDDDELGNISMPSANIKLGAIRQPLQEIKHDLLVTPMSITDVSSPMSIDRSMLNNLELKSAFSPRRERESFYSVEEYKYDILAYMKEVERKHRPKYGYMKKQPDINSSMRTILVDWLVEVCEEYKLHNETLYLGVSYIDRFLSIMSVVRAKLQLVGTSAMFIAAKYEEIYPPEVNEFVYITDQTYTKSQVLRMEQLILKALTFDLALPTGFTFLTAYSTINSIPDKVNFLASYISELSLLECEPYLKYCPSKISASAIALARYLLKYPIWSKDLLKITGYDIMDLKEIILHLRNTHMAAVNSVQQAIQEKYKANKYLEVSKIPSINLDEELFDEIIEKMKRDEELAVANENNNEDVRKMISSLIFV